MGDVAVEPPVAGAVGYPPPPLETSLAGDVLTGATIAWIDMGNFVSPLLVRA
jgi:hypothetical protein